MTRRSRRIIMRRIRKILADYRSHTIECIVTLGRTDFYYVDGKRVKAAR